MIKSFYMKIASNPSKTSAQPSWLCWLDIDGVVTDNVFTSGFMRENGSKMKIAGQLTSDEEFACVFPSENEHKAAVDAAVQSKTDDGALETLNNKWGLTQ